MWFVGENYNNWTGLVEILHKITLIIDDMYAAAKGKVICSSWRILHFWTRIGSFIWFLLMKVTTVAVGFHVSYLYSVILLKNVMFCCIIELPMADCE